MGCHLNVVILVRDLKDIEILKSYLLLVWSQWDYLDDHGFNMMGTSMREDFGGIEMSSHRADLLQRLDHVLAQLDRGLEHLQQNKPWLDEYGLQRMKRQYGELRKILLEVDREALKVLTCASSRLTTPSELHQLTWTRTGSHSTFMCAPHCLSIGGRLGCLILVSLHH